MRVLVVEDNEVVAQAIAAGLRDRGIAVDVAGDGGAGLDKAGLSPYDVIVLDRDLPVVHGDDVCARLAGRAGGARILMLTAAGAPDDRVDGLNLGADDYRPSRSTSRSWSRGSARSAAGRRRRRRCCAAVS